MKYTKNEKKEKDEKKLKNCLTDADINDIILSALNEALRLGEVWRGSEVVITRRS